MREQTKLKRKKEFNKGITLIALVITIIILLILTAISIATLTGENGVLTKANEAQMKTDIADTKELIKLEIMGKTNEKESYTNADVIEEVKKITGNVVEEGEEFVKSQKENEVPILDLWKKELVIYVPGGSEETNWLTKVPFEEGQVWSKEFIRSFPENADYLFLHASVSGGEGEAIQFNANAYDYPYLYFNGVVVKWGEALIPNGVYELDL